MTFLICSDSKTVSRFGICITLREKMSPTPRLKSSGLPRYNNLGQISWCWKSLFLKISNLLRFKTVSRFVICITLREKMSPTPRLKSSGLPRYNNLGQISWCWKIVIFKNFKFVPIWKRFRDSGSTLLCEQKCPPHHLSNPQGYRVYNNLGQISWCWKIVIFKNFKFAPIQNGFEIRDLHHFARKNVSHTTSQILRVTEIQQFRSNQLMLKIVIFKNSKFAPIWKRFRDSGSTSLCEKKCLPHHLSNPRGYRDTTI